METLRGVFPPKQIPHKRDFLKENVMKIKAIQKQKELNAIEKNPSKTSYRNKLKQTTNRTNVKGSSVTTIKAPPTRIQKALSETSLGILSGRRDQSSQTTDPENELFYKDVIIRYPSLAVLDSLNNQQSSKRQNFRRSKDSMRSQVHVNYVEEENEHTSRINNNISKLNEFLETGSITRKNVPAIVKIDESDRDLRHQQFRKSSLVPSQLNYKLPNDTRYAPYYTNDSSNLPSPSRRSTINNYPRCLSPNSDQSDVSESIPFSNLNVNDTPTKDMKMKKNKNSKISDLPSNYKLGQVPKYLKERKENINRERDKANEYDPDCPPNHVALTESDRKDSLEIAKKRYKDLIDELNKMPMTNETLKIRRRKIEIEKELDILEASIKIFSRQKVYVKIDE